MFNLEPLETSDLITLTSIVMTAIFSFLLWRATVSSNKIAKAIEKSNANEKASISNQNRYLVIFNLNQILSELNKHSESSSIGRDGRDVIKKALGEIEESNLSNFFNQIEIERVMDFLNFMNGEFNKKVLRGGRAYSHNPFNATESDREKLREQIRAYNRREIGTIDTAKEKITALLDILK